MYLKAACRTLVKLTPALLFSQFVFVYLWISQLILSLSSLLSHTFLSLIFVYSNVLIVHLLSLSFYYHSLSLSFFLSLLSIYFCLHFLFLCRFQHSSLQRMSIKREENKCISKNSSFNLLLLTKDKNYFASRF